MGFLEGQIVKGCHGLFLQHGVDAEEIVLATGGVGEGGFGFQSVGHRVVPHDGGEAGGVAGGEHAFGVYLLEGADVFQDVGKLAAEVFDLFRGEGDAGTGRPCVGLLLW